MIQTEINIFKAYNNYCVYSTDKQCQVLCTRITVLLNAPLLYLKRGYLLNDGVATSKNMKFEFDNEFNVNLTQRFNNFSVHVSSTV